MKILKYILLLSISIYFPSKSCAVLTNQQYISVIQQNAKLGNAEAQFLLGNMYLKGLGFTKNIPKAVRWYIKSAEQGYAPAQAIIGTMYYRGEYLPQNYAKAAEWFVKSAQQNDAYAELMVGYMYENSQGLSRDLSKAKKYYKLACLNQEQRGCNAYQKLK